MNTLNHFSTVFAQEFGINATNSAGIVFKTTNTVMNANGPIKNFAAITNIGIVASNGLLEMAGICTYSFPVAGNIGGSAVYRINCTEIFETLTRIAEDTGNLWRASCHERRLGC